MNSERFRLYLEGKPVTTEDEYLEVLGFIEYLEKKIDGKWLEPEKKKYTDAHQMLANAMLAYEIETNKIPF